MWRKQEIRTLQDPSFASRFVLFYFFPLFNFIYRHFVPLLFCLCFCLFLGYVFYPFFQFSFFSSLDSACSFFSFHITSPFFHFSLFLVPLSTSFLILFSLFLWYSSLTSCLIFFSHFYSCFLLWYSFHHHFLFLYSTPFFHLFLFSIFFFLSTLSYVPLNIFLSFCICFSLSLICFLLFSFSHPSIDSILCFFLLHSFPLSSKLSIILFFHKNAQNYWNTNLSVNQQVSFAICFQYFCFSAIHWMHNQNTLTHEINKTKHLISNLNSLITLMSPPTVKNWIFHKTKRKKILGTWSAFIIKNCWVFPFHFIKS